MKRIISILLAIVISVCSLSIGASSAFAADSKYNAQKQQYNAQNSDFNFGTSGNVKSFYNIDSRTFCLNYSGYVAKKGKTIASIKWDSGSIDNLFMYNNYIYYVRANKIMRCKKDGSSKQTIVSFDEKYDASFIVYNGKIYYNLIKRKEGYVTIEYTRLYSASLKGKNKKLIAKTVKSNFYAYKNKLYFIRDGKLKCYNIKTKKTSNVGSKSMKGKELCNMEGNNLYYYSLSGDWDNICNVYKINVSTRKVSKIKKFYVYDPIHSIMVSSSNIYLTTGTGAGNGFAKVNGSSLNYNSYNSKYDSAGDSLAFYKNYIVVDNYVYKNYSYRFDKYVKLVKIK